MRVRTFTLELSEVGLYTSEGEDFYLGTGEVGLYTSEGEDFYLGTE